MAALERLLLRDAEMLARRVGDDDRKAVAYAVARGRQKVRAADDLWSNGHAAEGLRLARESFEETAAAVPAVARVLGLEGPELRAVLAKRGIAAAGVARAASAQEKLATPLPVRDRDVAPAHAELFDLFQLARRDVDRAVSPVAATARSIQLARAGRISALVVSAIAAISIAWIATRPRQGIHAEASVQFATGREFSGAMAVDGLAQTAWLLPDGTQGTLDITIEPPRRVERITITNAHNPPWLDRASREIAIDVLSGGRVARTIETTFETLESPPTPRPLDVGVDGVDRIRIRVISWHRSSGGIADVAIE